MASSRDIRRRIKSVKSTAQITKAMQMVAASKMRKAQQAALAGRPYTTTMNRMLAELLPATGDFSHPLMERRPGGSRCVILVSTDKGLCGALNSTLFREAAKFDKDTTVFISAGRKAGQFLARARRSLLAEFSYKDAPLFSEARAISKFVQEGFLKGEYHQVDVLSPTSCSPSAPEVSSRTADSASSGAGVKNGLPCSRRTEFYFDADTRVLGCCRTFELPVYQCCWRQVSEHSAAWGHEEATLRKHW